MKPSGVSVNWPTLSFGPPRAILTNQQAPPGLIRAGPFFTPTQSCITMARTLFGLYGFPFLLRQPASARALLIFAKL